MSGGTRCFNVPATCREAFQRDVYRHAGLRGRGDPLEMIPQEKKERKQIS